MGRHGARTDISETGMEETVTGKKISQFTKNFIFILLAAVVSGMFAWLSPMQAAEYWFSDSFFVHSRPVDNRIKIIGIDEKSLGEMGQFQTWTRQQAADLLNAFDTAYAPAVIAFDINYVGERDEQGDAALVEAAKRFEAVVMASHISFSTRREMTASGESVINTMYAELVENPYEALRLVTTQGFTNVIQDKDNYVRRSVLSIDSGEIHQDNFAFEVYRRVQEQTGGTVQYPRTDGNGVYEFDYTAAPGGYEVYSYTDIVHGRCDMRLFADSIVLVGAYCSGMLDQYLAPIARGQVMNGVEVQANHVNALLDGRTLTELPAGVNAWIVALTIGLYALLLCCTKMAAAIGAGAVLLAGSCFTAGVLYNNGWYWRVFYVVLFLLLLMAARIIGGYVQERAGRHRIINIFKKYVAPQVVGEIAKKKELQIELGGETKEIAVLFADIRGFSSMSEALPPERVIGILNRYLGLVTDAIFKHDGMLDKFIGDAVMAVYNAPLAVEDYRKKAMQTAADVISGMEALNTELKKEFGIEIACGIGIHSGKAVVGNIGCSHRMDYTAIGDTVNIAERLESIAPGGCIYVTEEIYQAVKDMYCGEAIGYKALKGKQEEVLVYRMEVQNGSECIK